MKKRKAVNRRIIACLLSVAVTSTMMMTACTSDGNSEDHSGIIADTDDSAESMQQDEKTAEIRFSGSEIVITGEGAEINKDDGGLKITAAGSYDLSGNLKDSRIYIEAGKKDTVKLILNGVEVNNSKGSALYAKKCGSLVLIAAEGTENIFSDGKDYISDSTTAESSGTAQGSMSDTGSSDGSSTSDAGSDDSSTSETDAAVYVKDNLTIMGEGKLTVNGNCMNGIKSKDTLRISGGNIEVNSERHGITGRDNLIIEGGNITVNAKNGDGMKSTYSDTDDESKGHVSIENASIIINAGGDGIQAEKNLSISSGDYRIVTGTGSESATGHSDGEDSIKGIKSGGDMTISGGNFNIDAYNDALHSKSNLTISGGTFELNSGDDAVHADLTLAVSNGTIRVGRCYEGLEGTVVDISGGTIDVTASDDGINASGGKDNSGLGNMDGGKGFGRFIPQGGFPSMPDGVSGMPGGEPPSMPDGMSGMPGGEVPSMPDGVSGMPGGEVPSMPDGASGMPGGEVPSMPDGVSGATEETGNTESSGSDESTLSPCIKISGGTVYVNAQGDGIDSNGDISISGGMLIVNGTEMGGNGILDHDGGFDLSGGTVIGAGTSDMLELPDSSSSQKTIAVLFSQKQDKGTLVYVTDKSGKVVAAMAPEKNYQCFLFSTSDLTEGTEYTVYTGGSAKGSDVHGYYENAEVSGGTEYCKFTLGADAVTYVDQSGITTYRGFSGPGRNMQGNFRP